MKVSVKRMKYETVGQYKIFEETSAEFLERYPQFARRPEKSGLEDIREAFGVLKDSGGEVTLGF